MIPFQTTAEEKTKVADHAHAMNEAGLPRDFVGRAMEIAMVDQGMYDLLALWSGAKDSKEREEIIADIQDLIEEEADAPRTRVEKPIIHFDELDRVGKDVLAFKRHLHQLIDKNGGVSAVARKTGIPQPSLSRMLGSASMPRRTTLFKIARALNLPESAIVTEWVR